MNNHSESYEALNKLQKQAVDDTEGPFLILAGPGTGKTQLLSVRAASIVAKKKAAPENILILTYTNAAAKAMKERLAAVIGLAGYDVEVGTFHSFANNLIQESEEAANYIGDKVQLDEIEQTRAMEYILDNTDGLEEIRPFRAPYTYPKEILRRISDLKRKSIYPADFKR
ncbi:MAG: ATP-dependent helicase, partial [Candidatus Omnitrophica bacterium]|nr:ATP-dependent helicase [Candidatus Omnitrophota bacterium]